jgi:hypothetical protein
VKLISRIMLVVLSLSLVAALVGCSGKTKSDSKDFAAGKSDKTGNVTAPPTAAD